MRRCGVGNPRRIAAKQRCCFIYNYKVCVYAICKNESQFVDRFMDSMAEADYICILDTGSTDDTVEKLKARGAIVEQRNITPWRFDNARNASLALIPDDAEICCCIDLDETFHTGWRSALESAWSQGADRVRYRYTWSFQPDGSEGVVFWADKIHRNGAFRWCGAVHEVLEYIGSAPCRFIEANGIQLDHHPDPNKSRGQYLPLLELAVSEEPDNDRNCHYLGREYMYHSEWKKAIETLCRHLSLPSAQWADERSASMRYIARCYRMLGNAALARTWLYRSIAEAPHLREGYIELADLLYFEQNWHGLVYILSEALQLTERPRSYITEPFAWGSLPYDYLSIAYYHLDQIPLATEACRRALSLSPQNERLEKNLLLFEQMRA